MVVLNIYSKIEPICISKKLGLYIDNLPDDWKSELKERILDSKEIIIKNQNKYNITKKYNFNEIYIKILKEEYNENDTEEEVVDKIVENMICIYFDFDYDDMPLGDWKTNCFDGRFCEEDYAEKIINFIVFIYKKLEYEDKTNVFYIYSSNYDSIENAHQIFYYNAESLRGINTLIQFGKIFDNCLKNRNDYLKFDFIINSIHDHSKNYEYNFFRMFSLCQLFLENKHEYELDWKLPYFFNNNYLFENRKDISKILRIMRNKIAHGDFVKLEEIIEEYHKKVMVDFSYDYSEYSRKNWALIDAYLLIEEILKNIIKMMLYENEKLEKIKNMKDESQLSYCNNI